MCVCVAFSLPETNSKGDTCCYAPLYIIYCIISLLMILVSMHMFEPNGCQ